MNEVDAFIASLPDPDLVAQSEYRAVYELVTQLLEGYEDDSGFTVAGYAEAVLDEVERAVRVIRARIKEN